MSAKVSDVSETKISEKTAEPVHIPLFFLFLCTICICCLYSNILAYHISLTSLHSYGNDSAEDFYNVSDYRDFAEGRVNITVQIHRFLSNPQKESLITVVPIGGLIAFFPMAFIYNMMGFRRTFAACALISIIPSVLLPICVGAKTFVLAILIRLFQGFALAAIVPYACKLSVFLPFNHSAIPTIVFAYLQIAAFFTFPICGLLAWSSLGWHSAHYGPAIFTFIVYVIFLCIHFDEEFKDKASEYGIMDALCNYERSRSRLLNLHLPYLSIYQDVKVWSSFLGAFGYFTALQLYLQFGPTFLDKVVGHSQVSTGFMLMIPPFCNLLISFLCYGLFPRLASVSIHLNTVANKMRVFNTLGTVLPGVLFMLIGLFDADTQPASVTALYIVASSLLGFCSCGFFRMVQLLSGEYHLFLLLNLSLVNMASMFLTSLLNVLIAKNNEYTSWSVIFLMHGGILIVTNIIFCLFTSSEQAHWAKEGYEDTSIRPYRSDPLPQRPL